jgi:hypothetical protein
MKRSHWLSALGIVLCVACSLGAQEKPGTVAALEFQKPKNGMVTQYEAGRKQKAAWHKQQNDPLPLFVWETLSGENTGSYIVGRLSQHWADFDKPAIPDETDLAEFQKVIGAYVDSVTARYYEYMPKVSNPTDAKMPAKFAEILTFYVRYGKESDFRSAIGRVYEGALRTKWPVNYEWYELVKWRTNRSLRTGSAAQQLGGFRGQTRGEALPRHAQRRFWTVGSRFHLGSN